jgi:hypothetical protein
MKNPYKSIVNYNIELRELYKDKLSEFCYIQEKIHGQNVSFRVTYGNVIEVRSRNQIIGTYTNDTLINCTEIVTESIVRDILQMIYVLKFKYKHVDEFIIYGELFGGYYNNKRCDKRIIQHGVQYSTDHNFIVFDVSVNGEFLDYFDLAEINSFNNRNLPLYGGEPLTLDKSIDLILGTIETAESQIYKLYGEEYIENNYVEGFILRSLNDPNFRIKFVSNRFKEVRNNKFIDTTKINLIDDIYNKFNTDLIIEKSINKLNIDLLKDSSRFKYLINMIFDELNDELKFEDKVDISLLKSVAGKIFGKYYKDKIIGK